MALWSLASFLMTENRLIWLLNPSDNSEITKLASADNGRCFHANLRISSLPSQLISIVFSMLSDQISSHFPETPEDHPVNYTYF